MPTKLKAILFDAGNTLLFPRVDELAVELTTAGYPSTPNDFFEAERQGKRKLDDWLWPQLDGRELPPQVDRMYWLEYVHALLDRLGVPLEHHGTVTHQIVERFREIRFWSRVFPDTEASLETLKSTGYKLGVISNSVGTIEEQIRRAGLSGYFEFVLDSAVVGVEKPNPAIFKMALDRADVAPDAALFLGDTYSIDVGGAKMSGIRGVLIDRPGVYPDDLPCPRVRSLTEFVALVEKIASEQT